MTTEQDMDNFAKSLIGKSPFEIHKSIHEFDKVNGKASAMAALQQSQEFSDYCTQQLHAFLDNRLALPQRDAEHIDTWWKFSLNDFSLEDIQKAWRKVDKHHYIASDRYLDLEKNVTFLKFVKNIPDIKAEMELPNTEALDAVRRNQRQKIVDFVRFMESGKSSRQAIEEKNWQLLKQNFDGFPKMPIEFIAKIYNSTKPQKTDDSQNKKNERYELIKRILTYRLDDICSGAWKPQLSEILFLETFLKDANLDVDLVQETLDILKDMKKEAQSAPVKEEPEQSIVSDEKTDEKTDDEKSEKTGVTTINFIRDENASQKENVLKIDQVEDDDENKVSNDENLALTTNVQDTQATAKPQDLQAEKDTPAKPLNWQEKTLTDWQEWGKQNHKIVQEYQPSEKTSLAFKIYENASKVKNDEFEADITYRQENDMVVKGKDGNVPSDEIFAAIVAQAKKNGPEIRFGDIQDDVFKAKLMLACLNDKDIKILNPPKLSELSNIPEDLRAKLEEKMPSPTTHAKERMKKLNNDRSGASNPRSRTGNEQQRRLRRRDGSEKRLPRQISNRIKERE